ncbi:MULTISPECIES: dihydropteroate synthase [Halolamina]|uniref:dihydropteroate synthase n=1 Tax=Halolamina pelagica TaxID=699431 RepID=A0A1I5RU02_9EURY|nr:MULTISPECIES: dihydropteroate synthase [Halolamina]NHX35338.1 dihydropteroate synthase [Halolamina sp. R1-12]SFP61860.1 dihydropteroate synthase [Halolamina pelagica]
MNHVDIAGLPVGDGHPPRIMGVLNMSVESNYDPSTWGDVDGAVEHAEQMATEGADIIDVGLQSSNPKNPWQAVDTELDRLDRALEVVDRADCDAVWSIETRYAEVADAALDGGFDMVNDVCGFADPDMPDVCEKHDAAVVKMASPPDIQSPGHLKSIDDCFAALERGGFTEKTIIDPAFGGWYDEKTHEDNWEMFRRLREFRAFGRPMLTATNREDFLGVVADRPETEDQLAVSLAAATMEVERGADIVRTHDVPETADVVAVAAFLGDGDRANAGDADGDAASLPNVAAREVERNVGLRGHNGVEPGEAATLSFRTTGLNEPIRERLAAIGADYGVLVAAGAGERPSPENVAGGRGDSPASEGTFVAGTASAFEDALAEIAEVDALQPLAGRIRRTLARERLA